MSIIQSFVEFVRAMCGLCPDGGKHCEHFDYTSGAVTFYRCCKCKERSSMHVDNLDPPL